MDSKHFNTCWVLKKDDDDQEVILRPFSQQIRDD